LANTKSGTEPKRPRPFPKGRPTDEQALAAVEELIGEDPREPDRVLEYLHRVQDHFGYVGAEHVVALARVLSLAHTEVYEVASFYDRFDVVKEGEQPPPPVTVQVCDSVACDMAGARPLLDELANRFDGQVRVERAPCVGRCAEAPVAVAGRCQIGHADADKVTDAVAEGRLAPEVPDYTDYHSYRDGGGYQIFREVAEGKRDSDAVIDEIESAGLRGLGGAGFPAAIKWRTVRDQPGTALVAINIDESEPGTFKDRYYLERDPHRFLEGTLIAAKAVGANGVYIYLRDEYDEGHRILNREIAALQADPPADLPPIQLRRGAGAYICGEESAMVESMEGHRGMPRLRPPLVAQVGLFGAPTLEQNMETMHWVRDILEQGADWYKGYGRHGRSGLRSFSVSGRVNNPGVCQAPAGITLNELIEEHCGGMLPGHQLYGYLVGGVSGGILPASLADVPLDFDTLQEHGCFIGSFAIVVLSDHDTARHAALNAMEFFADESCGKCTPCRVGTAKAAHLMAQPEWNQDLLEELADSMVDASICGLGQAAPNPLNSVLKYFREELENGR
jgi:formate dehydrogenase